jgi:hypothetical protein
MFENDKINANDLCYAVGLEDVNYLFKSYEEIYKEERRFMIESFLCRITDKLNIPNGWINRDSDNDMSVTLEEGGCSKDAVKNEDKNVDEDFEPLLNSFVDTLTNHFSAEKKPLVEELKKVKSTYNGLVSKLEDKLECPVCFSIPKEAPINVCLNGHVVCQTCRKGSCPPTCSAISDQRGGTSLLALTVVENIPLERCDFTENGCKFQCSPDKQEKLSIHEMECKYRDVNCPNFSCLEEVPLISLVEHSMKKCIRHEFSSSPAVFCSKSQDLSSMQKDDYYWWRPGGIIFNQQHFFLNIFHDNEGSRGLFHFYVIMAGSETESKDYKTILKIYNKALGEKGRHSVQFIGDICPIEVADRSEALDAGYCFSITDSQMKKIFNSDITFQFWVMVDIKKESMG